MDFTSKFKERFPEGIFPNSEYMKVAEMGFKAAMEEMYNEGYKDGKESRDD